MKKTLLSILTAAFAALLLPCCISCSDASKNALPVPGPSDNPGQDQEEQPQKPDQKTDETKPQAGTYTFTVSALKESWEAGDQIYIHGSYGPAAKVITLTAEDISEDGKMASTQLDANFLRYLAAPDGLYAAWPADAVLKEDGMMEAPTTFEKTDIPLAVAYLKGTNFEFVDISSALSFSVQGFPEFIFAGNERPGVRFISFSPEYTSNIKDFTNRKTDGYPFIKGVVSEGKTIIWIPGTITFKRGFTLFFGQDDEWSYAYTVNQDFKLSSGEMKDLGDITASIEPYTGPAPKIPEMGKRTKYTVKVNELSGICLSTDGTFLWGVGDDGHLARIGLEGEVLETRSISGDCEDITINPATGDLLIGLEPNGVGRVAAPDFKKLETLFKIADAAKYGNAGLEGLTYYKDNMVYAGTQTGSDLFLCDLGTGEVIWKKRLREIFPSITEIGGLCYDPLTDWLWIIDSEARKITALTGDAEMLLGAWSVRGIENPESLCVDHIHSCIWVGDDYGSTSYLYRYEFTGLDDAIPTE